MKNAHCALFNSNCHGFDYPMQIFWELVDMIQSLNSLCYFNCHRTRHNKGLMNMEVLVDSTVVLGKPLHYQLIYTTVYHQLININKFLFNTFIIICSEYKSKWTLAVVTKEPFTVILTKGICIRDGALHYQPAVGRNIGAVCVLHLCHILLQLP